MPRQPSCGHLTALLHCTHGTLTHWRCSGTARTCPLTWRHALQSPSRCPQFWTTWCMLAAMARSWGTAPGQQPAARSAVLILVPALEQAASLTPAESRTMGDRPTCSACYVQLLKIRGTCNRSHVYELALSTRIMSHARLHEESRCN